MHKYTPLHFHDTFVLDATKIDEFIENYSGNLSTFPGAGHHINLSDALPLNFTRPDIRSQRECGEGLKGVTELPSVRNVLGQRQQAAVNRQHLMDLNQIVETGENRSYQCYPYCSERSHINQFESNKLCTVNNPSRVAGGDHHNSGQLQHRPHSGGGQIFCRERLYQVIIEP